jgi:hypothetical protein
LELALPLVLPVSAKQSSRVQPCENRTEKLGGSRLLESNTGKKACNPLQSEYLHILSQKNRLYYLVMAEEELLNDFSLRNAVISLCFFIGFMKESQKSVLNH